MRRTVPSCSRHSPGIEWVGSSKGALKKFPATVQDQVGFALYQAQAGLKHRDVKPAQGTWRPCSRGRLTSRRRHLPGGVTQAGKFARNMRLALPNASFIGFTGVRIRGTLVAL